MLRAGLCLGALVIGEVLVHTTPGTHGQMRRYTAAQNGKVVRLHDAARATGIAILPSAGNLAVEMKVKGHNVLRFPYAFRRGLIRGRVRLDRYPVPFLWADRARRAGVLRQRPAIRVRHERSAAPWANRSRISRFDGSSGR